MWNSLPLEAVNAQSLSVFKATVNSILFPNVWQSIAVISLLMAITMIKDKDWHFVSYLYSLVFTR